MKNLNRRYLRNLKSNLSFYIAVAFLTAMAIVMQIAIAGSYQAEQDYMNSLLSDGRVEDGQLITYREIPGEELADLEDRYDIQLEQMRSVDTASDSEPGLDVRIFHKTEKTDLYRVTIGRDAESTGEIILNAFLHEAASDDDTSGGRGLEVGDEITLDGRTYTITGFFVRPDYLFCLRNLSDIFSTVHDFGIGIVCDEDFSAFSAEDVSSYYTIRYLSDNEREVREQLNEDYGIVSYTPRESNSRIVTSLDQLEELGSMENTILPMIVLLVMALTAVILGRKIRNEQQMIGVLHALGYRKYEIALHYSVFGAIAGLLGSVLGLAIGIPLIAPMAKLCFESKIEPFPITHSVGAGTLLMSVLVPACGYVLSVFLSALHAMRGTSAEMLHGGSSASHRRRRLRLSGWRAGFRTKYRVRAILGNLSRTVTVLLGFAIAGALMVFMLSCTDSLQVYVDQSVEQTGSYEYEYILNTLEAGTPEEGCGCLSASFGVEDHGDQLSLLGTDDNPYLNFLDEDGEPMELQKGSYYLSDMAAEMYGVSTGDSLTFYDMASLKEYTVRVAGVFRNASMSLLVTDRASAAGLLELPEDSYNVVMSDHTLPYSDSELARTIVKEEFKAQLADNVLRSMKQYTGPVLVIGVIICILVIYLMVNMLITENSASISMLKILGYRDPEIRRMVVNIYHALVPPGIVLGLAAGYLMNKYNFIASTEAYNTYIAGTISVRSVVIYVLTVLAAYVLSLLLLYRKVGRISMTETLKNDQE